MIYILFQDDKIVGQTTKSPYTGTPEMLKEIDGVEFNKVQDRWDWKSFEVVEKIATALTEMNGEKWLAVDNGQWTSPRYDVMLAPKVGDKVSQGFNGDYYPEGEIIKITAKWQVTTSTGVKFRRRGQSACWLRTGGTFGMVAGHVDERNPHF